MLPVMARDRTTPPRELDVVERIRRILQQSPEPLTLPRIRAALPPDLRQLDADVLTQHLERQIAAHVLFLYPRYRSTSARYWDRPMPVHIAGLLREALAAGPLVWCELRRRLPDYAKTHAEAVLQEEIAAGRLFLHPPLSPRLGARYGVARPSAQPYVQRELNDMVRRLESVGFSRGAVHEALTAILASAAPPPRLADPWPSYSWAEADSDPTADEPAAAGALAITR